ncbi:hypothetical protein FH972_021597 [Carpinus fangiana]|uniref:Uncharacterized protein n=1 Tax=Carpinus fangiana TaxID=176857 RepID=A0A5N6KQ49_9ROSI|nr:hypothetical protein FH972_021597 [Carpinus fangiana]
MDELAANLLSQLKRSSAPVESKLALFNQLKSNIKHQRVPESAQGPTLECIRLAIISQISTPLVNTGFSALGHFIKRLSLQDQVSAIFAPRQNIVGVLIEKLGDQKETHRSAASQCLCDLWSAKPDVIEKAIRDGAIGSSHARAKEAGLQWVAKMHADQSMPFRNFVSPMVECLDHQDGTVRDCAKIALVDLFRNAPGHAKSDLKRQLNAQNIRKSIASYIISQIEGAEDPNASFVSTASSTTSRAPPPPPAVSRTTRPITPALESRLPDHAHGEPTLPPSAEVDKIEPLYVHTARELDDIFRIMQPCFEGKEDEGNWKQRDNNVLKLRRLTRGNAPADLHVPFLAGIKALLDGILKVVNTLRTTMSTNGCLLVQELAKTLGSSIDSLVEILLQNLVKMTAATKNISAQNGNTTVEVILQSVSYNSRLMQHIWLAVQDKNVQPRQFAAGWLKIVLKKHAHNKVSFEHSGGLEVTEKCIRKGLTDANPKVREGMRSTYWAFEPFWPVKAEAIMEDLEPKYKQLLQNHADNPNAGPGSFTRSVGPSTANPRVAASGRQSLREQIAAQRQAAAKRLPERPNSAMAELSPVKQGKPSAPNPRVASGLSNVSRPAPAPATRPTKPQTTTSSTTQGSLMSAPMRRPRRPDVARPATADPYASRNMMRAETPTSTSTRSPVESPVRPVSKGSVSSLSSGHAKANSTSTIRSPVGRSPQHISPQTSPKRTRADGHVASSLSKVDNRRSMSPTSPQSARRSMLSSRDGKHTSRIPFMSPPRTTQDDRRPLSSHSHAADPNEDDNFTLVLPSQANGTRTHAGIAEMQREEDVTVYEDPEAEDAEEQGTTLPPKLVLEELPVNERAEATNGDAAAEPSTPSDDERPLSPSKKPTVGGSSPEKSETLKNRRLVISGTERIRARTLDLHGFRRLQELVKNSVGDPAIHLSELLAALVDYVEASNESLKAGASSKAPSLRSQALATIRAIVVLHRRDEAVRRGYARALCATVRAKSFTDSTSHVSTELDKTGEDVIKHAHEQAEACTDAVLHLAESSIAADIEGRRRAVTAAFGVLSKLLVLAQTRSEEISTPQRQRMGKVAVRYLDDTDADVRRADIEFCLALRSVHGDGERQAESFWRTLHGAREQQLNLIAYYIARRERGGGGGGGGGGDAGFCSARRSTRFHWADGRIGAGQISELEVLHGGAHGKCTLLASNGILITRPFCPLPRRRWSPVSVQQTPKEFIHVPPRLHLPSCICNETVEVEGIAIAVLGCNVVPSSALPNAWTGGDMSGNGSLEGVPGPGRVSGPVADKATLEAGIPGQGRLSAVRNCAFAPTIASCSQVGEKSGQGLGRRLPSHLALPSPPSTTAASCRFAISFGRTHPPTSTPATLLCGLARLSCVVHSALLLHAARAPPPPRTSLRLRERPDKPPALLSSPLALPDPHTCPTETSSAATATVTPSPSTRGTARSSPSLAPHPPPSSPQPRSHRLDDRFFHRRPSSLHHHTQPWPPRLRWTPPTASTTLSTPRMRSSLARVAILEEGKAFELAGNRWHINCFRCNTCGVLLDSDANLLLLGDGSLICNNCTYSCSACGNKIEDLAILTGDQAFCASCFKCRNCKRKIENLRYARTSQGIFCMTCHESLMARRRKNKKAQRATSANSNGSGNRPDKALPDLPKALAQAEPKSAFSPDEESLASVDNVDKGPRSRKEGGYVDYKRAPPSSTYDDDKGSSVRLNAAMTPVHALHANAHRPPTVSSSVLPSSTYSGTRAPSSASRADSSLKTTDEDFFLPITLDPTPTTETSPRNNTNNPSVQTRSGLSENYRDDFKDMLAGSAAARSGSQERRAGRSNFSSPHIAFQEKSRHPSTDAGDPRTKRNVSGAGTPRSPPSSSPAVGTLPTKAFTSPNLASDVDSFRLQDAPKRKSSGSKKSPLIGLVSQLDGSDERPPTMPERGVERPTRGDSLNKNNLKQPVPDRKAVPRTDGELEQARQQLDTQNDDSGISSPFNVSSSRELNGGPPPRNASRPGTSGTPADFTAPRSAPPPPKHKPNESVTSIQSDGHFNSREPGTPLPPHTATGSFSMEDEMGRILRGENDEHPGIFRKMSKAVKHGRSHSDKIGSSPSPKWAKGSRNGSVDISSPLISGAGANSEDTATLRNKLRYAEQKIAELEAEKMRMEEGLNGTAELQQMNTELRQKRTTMAFLDSQKEIISRELDVMTDHLAKAKEAKSPIDAQSFKDEVLRDLMAALKKLKDQQSVQIEDLMAKKNELTQEITTLIQMKDKGFQEYESLSTKNRELREMNERVIESIRQMSEHGKISNNNALGIYTANYGDGHSAGGSQTDIRTITSHEPTPSMLTGDTELETPTVMTAPKVVDIRKGQPKKFNWKKGGDRFAKNVSKGIKGAFGGTQTTVKEEQFTETLPYGAQQAGAPPMIGDLPAQGGRGDKRGFFGQLQGNPRIGSPVSAQATDSGTLFGSDLTGRCDYEQRIIPVVITRCIEEVEARGMDAEGIYRKSGSTSMVNAIKNGFETTDKNDISDPDIDIHAVTSCLKQYLRKLPIPLITWDAYDPLLSAAAHEEPRERIRALRKVVADLPDRHRDALEYLIGHLSRVIEMEPQNLVSLAPWRKVELARLTQSEQMTPTNVGVVFAPTIMRPRQLEREISDMELQRKAVEHLLNNYAETARTRGGFLVLMSGAHTSHSSGATASGRHLAIFSFFFGLGGGGGGGAWRSADTDIVRLTLGRPGGHGYAVLILNECARRYYLPMSLPAFPPPTGQPADCRSRLQFPHLHAKTAACPASTVSSVGWLASWLRVAPGHRLLHVTSTPPAYCLPPEMRAGAMPPANAASTARFAPRTDGNSSTSRTSPSIPTEEEKKPRKARRVLKACDFCHSRSIRCRTSAEDSQRCQNCYDYGQPCMFTRPSMKRGLGARKKDGGALSAAGRPEGVPKAALVADQATIVDLVEVYFEVVYPIFPLFHRASIVRRVARAEFNTSKPFYAVVMAICALSAARVKDGALFSGHWNLETLSRVSSATFFDAAEVAVPKNIDALEQFEYMRTVAMLSLISLQTGYIERMHFYMGIYNTFIKVKHWHEESKWPDGISVIERQERRRLFWCMYTLDVYAAAVFDKTVSYREAETSVGYPNELDDAILDDAEARGPLLGQQFLDHLQHQRALELACAPDKVHWLRGWNFTTDLYRVLEYVISESHMRKCIGSPHSPYNVYAPKHSSHQPEIFSKVKSMYTALPCAFKHSPPFTTDNAPATDRFAICAANITATLQLLRMAVYAADVSPSVEQKCQIVNELLQSFSLVPFEYLRVISTPLLFHLAGIGTFLGPVIQGPMSRHAYDMVRSVLLALADFLTGLEVGMSCANGASKRLRFHIGRIDDHMRNQEGLVGAAMGHAHAVLGAAGGSGSEGLAMVMHDDVGEMPEIRLPPDILQDTFEWAFDFYSPGGREDVPSSPL